MVITDESGPCFFVSEVVENKGDLWPNKQMVSAYYFLSSSTVFKCLRANILFSVILASFEHFETSSLVERRSQGVSGNQSVAKIGAIVK